MAVWCFITDKMIHFIVNILCDGVKSNEENVFRGEGLPSLTQQMLNVMSVTMQKKVLRKWMNPVHQGVGGVVMEEECDVGSWDSSVVRAPDSWLKGHGLESLQVWQENCLLQGQLSVMILISVPVPLPCYHSSTWKTPVILPKVQWQVTAKYTCFLHMWLCMKWNGTWLYGVHRTHQDGSSFMWRQPCQRCKYTTLVDIQKRAIRNYSLT